MCQLNVFLISNEITVDSVMNLMADFGIEGDCITDDFKADKLSSKYNFYISPSYQRCHCHSFVTKFSSKEFSDVNIVEQLTKQHSDELDFFYDMKAFMSKKSYSKEKESFIKVYEELHEKLLNIESEFFKKHEYSSDLASELKDEMSNSHFHDEYRELITNNSKMYDSLMHYSKDFNAAADDIDELIKKAEEESFKYELEYFQLRDWIFNVIDKYGKIMFFSYWQDNSKPKIQYTKKITTEQISFELLAKLSYEELLDISN